MHAHTAILDEWFDKTIEIYPGASPGFDVAERGAISAILWDSRYASR